MMFFAKLVVPEREGRGGEKFISGILRYAYNRGWGNP